MLTLSPTARVLAGAALLSLVTPFLLTPSPAAPTASTSTTRTVRPTLPVGFVRNDGQWGDAIAYAASFRGMRAGFHRDGWTLTPAAPTRGRTVTAGAVRLRFADAEPSAAPNGAHPWGGRCASR